MLFGHTQVKAGRTSRSMEALQHICSSQTLLGSLNGGVQEGRSTWHEFEGSLWENLKEKRDYFKGLDVDEKTISRRIIVMRLRIRKNSRLFQIRY